MFYVVVGEANPKVYKTMSEARRACALAHWSIESFSTIKEAAARRKEVKGVGKQGLERKRQRSEQTPVLNRLEFENIAGKADQEDDTGFASWLHSQMVSGERARHFFLAGLTFFSLGRRRERSLRRRCAAQTQARASSCSSVVSRV